MDIKNYEDLSKPTLADLHVAINNSKREMENCLKRRDIRGFLIEVKFNLKLNKLLSKKANLARKENDMIEKQL